MAVPKRKNQMIKQMMQNIKIMKRELSKEEKEKMERKNRPINEKEHQVRIQKLKEIGLIK